MHPDTQAAMATAEQFIAAAMRLLRTHVGEQLAIAMATQLAEDYAKQATVDLATYEAREAVKH